MATVVGSSLFGDGAAAAVAVGDRRAEHVSGPEIIDSRSHLYPDSLHTMGWDVDGSGFRLVLSPDVPRVVERYLGDDVIRPPTSRTRPPLTTMRSPTTAAPTSSE